LCARHDLEVGQYLVEIEPGQTAATQDLLLYLTIYGSKDGDELWKGCLRMRSGAVAEVDVYGGSPLAFEKQEAEVGSD
jgi:hypothetical protein